MALFTDEGMPDESLTELTVRDVAHGHLSSAARHDVTELRRHLIMILLFPTIGSGLKSAISSWRAGT